MPVDPSAMEIHHLTAFSRQPEGGNPAAVIIGEMDDAAMQQLAAELGYSESAFLPAQWSGSECPIRYFSPEREIDFCGHATIAAACALALRRALPAITFLTRSGPVPVRMAIDEDGIATATLTSVPGESQPAPPQLSRNALGHLGWSDEVLDPVLKPALASAGARHLLLPLAAYGSLANLDYHFEGMRQLMAQHELTTVCLLWREGPGRFRVRNLFPVGGVVEDAATGAAAAALGAYLRLNDHAAAGRLLIQQGVEMGRPSEIIVDMPEDVSQGIAVTGAAVPIAPGR